MLKRRLLMESLERRQLFTAAPLPVLMVIADNRDFYYQEYGDTRISLEAAGLTVAVAATTTNPTTPHSQSGQGSGSGTIVPDIALVDVNAADYSAIVFVGGWGSSMYQYAFPGQYYDGLYNGDPVTKGVVNDLIQDFTEQDKYVTAICHGVMVLAWARIDDQSPLQGKEVSVPWLGSPGVFYNGRSYGYFELTQYEQAVTNGAIPNTVSGAYGDPNTVADDVVVTGKIITAENYDSAALFGQVVAERIWAEQPPGEENLPPQFESVGFSVTENSPLGTEVGYVLATDPNLDQTLTWTILGGNVGGAFALDSGTGRLTVANPAVVDYERNPIFRLKIQVIDNGSPALAAVETMTVRLVDIRERTNGSAVQAGGDLYIDGTAGPDLIYVWTDSVGAVRTWINGDWGGPYEIAASGTVFANTGDENDQIYASLLAVSLRADGGAGSDCIVGGSGDDWLEGGSGYDHLFGNEGSDFLQGQAGDDYLVGGPGQDFIIGGLGHDGLDGGDGEDLLIGGWVSISIDPVAMQTLVDVWRSADSFADRVERMQTGTVAGHRLVVGETVLDDATVDCIYGGAQADWLLLGQRDLTKGLEWEDRVQRI